MGREGINARRGRKAACGFSRRRPGEAQGFRPPKPPLGRAWIGAPVSFSVRFEVNHDVGVNDSSGSGTDFSTSWSHTGQERPVGVVTRIPQRRS